MSFRGFARSPCVVFSSPNPKFGTQSQAALSPIFVFHSLESSSLFLFFRFEGYSWEPMGGGALPKMVGEAFDVHF